MFISDRLVFLELQKTGTSHIRRILTETMDGTLSGKHNQASSEMFVDGRYFFGSVRNPWDWYCSLWAFGCDCKGDFYHQTTRGRTSLKGLGWRDNPYSAALRALRPRDPEKWRKTYRDINDVDAFRTWLGLVHDPKFFYDFGEGFGETPLSRVSGLMTFRYLKLLCTKAEDNSRLNTLKTRKDVENYEKDNCFVHHVIRNEHLNADLLAGLKDIGISVTSLDENKIVERPKTNTSSKRPPVEHYYDTDSENLVADRDWLIIQKYQYSPPSARVAV